MGKNFKIFSTKPLEVNSEIGFELGIVDERPFTGDHGDPKQTHFVFTFHVNGVTQQEAAQKLVEWLGK